MYSQKVMDHFRDPKNVGVVENADGKGVVGNPTCGDQMEITIKVENNVITDIKFRTFGCGAAIATSSMATELIQGKTINEALEVSNRAIAAALGGLPPIKMHCSVLAAEALRATLADYYARQGEHAKALALRDEEVEALGLQVLKPSGPQVLVHPGTETETETGTGSWHTGCTLQRRPGGGP